MKLPLPCVLASCVAPGGVICIQHKHTVNTGETLLKGFRSFKKHNRFSENLVSSCLTLVPMLLVFMEYNSNISAAVNM